MSTRLQRSLRATGAKDEAKESTRIAYTVHEVAELLGISRPMVYYLINERKLKSFKIGRRRLVSAKALLAWIEKEELRTSRGVLE